MKSPVPPGNYSSTWAASLVRRIDELSRSVFYRGRDMDIVNARLILTSPNGTRYSVTVDNAGTISTTALP